MVKQSLISKHGFLQRGRVHRSVDSRGQAYYVLAKGLSVSALSQYPGAVLKNDGLRS